MASNPAQTYAQDRARYPGMQVEEILTWRVWLAEHSNEFTSFDYNVRIGDGIDPGPMIAEPYRTNAINLSKLRLDAVGWQGDVPTIFEVERRARPSSVGQLLTYDAVWRNLQYSNVAPRLRIVCADLNPNIIPICRDANIQVDQVAVRFAVLASPAPDQPATPQT